MIKKSKETTKRRPAKKWSSLWAVVGSASQVVKNIALTEIKIWPQKSKQTFKKKTTIPKRVAQKQVFSLPIGRRKKLILAVDHASSSARHPKTLKKSSNLAQAKRSKRQQLVISCLLLIMGLGGATFFGMQTIASPIQAPPKPIKSHRPVSIPKTEQFLAPSNPVKLRIPAIELDSSLTTVGLASDGSIEVPPDYTIAGWYRSSPTPGEMGPSIIVGHLDNIHGVAVFWRLQELTPGQNIEVSREDGSIATFVIEKVKQVPQNESFPSAEVYGNTDKAALRLITCGGTFNHLTQHYSDNTIVFASLVPPSPGGS